MVRTIERVEQVHCYEKDGKISCTISRVTKNGDFAKETLNVTYAGFSGDDVRVYMTDEGTKAYRPERKLMECTVKTRPNSNDVSLSCFSPDPFKR